MFRREYPVGIRPEHADKSKAALAWDAVKKGWVTEDGRDQLFVGIWQIEIPYDPWPSVLPGWKKTRLEIRSDQTFILSDPPERMRELHNFRGTITGEWKIGYCVKSRALEIRFEPETLLPADRSETLKIWIQPQILMTRRKDGTNDQHLRLRPSPSWGPDREEYSFPVTPMWRKRIDE
jgi:hypothetical protein